MKWFRFYHEVYRDPKVQLLRPELFRFWVNVLCVASESNPRGEIESEDHLRLALGIDKLTLGRWLGELERLQLIHRGEAASSLGAGADQASSAPRPGADQAPTRRGRGCIRPHNWHERQPESDDAAKRKRKERETTSVNAPSEISRDMSQDKSRDMSGSRPRELDLDTDRDKEKKEEPPNPRKRGKAAEPPCVPDWIPGELWAEHRDVRRRKRGALTPRADRQIIAMLERIRESGFDPIEQLKRSCLKGWIEVFVPDRALPTNGTNGKHAYDPTPEEIARMNAACPEAALEADA